MEPRYYLSSKANKGGRSTVMLFLYAHEKRITVSTGKAIKPVNWNEKAQRARGSHKEALEFNNYLLAFGAKAIAVLTALIEKKETDIIEKFRKALKKESIEDAEKIKEDFQGINGSLISFIESLIETIPRSKGTLAVYNVTLNRLKKFQESFYKKPIHFESIDLDFYNQYIAFCEHENFALNTIGTEIKNIKFFMGEAEERELHSNLKFRSKKFKKPHEESFSIYLDEKRLETLSNLSLGTDPEKEKIRDLFVASCWLGLRVGDLLSVTDAHIRDNIISIYADKIGEYVDIPLHPTVRTIMQKHEGMLPNNDISETEFNKGIKEIARQAGMTEPVAYTITKGGEKKKMTVPMHDMISAHTARRSFATNMYKKGLNIQIIMALTGHKTESIFMSYVKSRRINAIKELEAIFN